MAETIIVRCSHCGEKIGEISYIPGKQVIGCPKCGYKTVVTIYENGQIKTSTY